MCGGEKKAHLGAMKGDGSDVRLLALLDHQSAFIFLEEFTRVPRRSASVTGHPFKS